MKIDNRALNAYTRSSVGGVSSAKPVATPASEQANAKSVQTPSTEAAQVSISKEARALASGQLPDANKVAALKEKVKEGKFEVDHRKVAERLLDTLG